jgi:hypothetical protein
MGVSAYGRVGVWAYRRKDTWPQRRAGSSAHGEAGSFPSECHSIFSGFPEISLEVNGCAWIVGVLAYEPGPLPSGGADLGIYLVGYQIPGGIGCSGARLGLLAFSFGIRDSVRMELAPGPFDTVLAPGSRSDSGSRVIYLLL